jgi:serine/threonine protein kinase
MESLSANQLAHLRPVRRLAERSDAGTWLMELPSGQQYVRKTMQTPFLAMRARGLFSQRLQVVQGTHDPFVARVIAGWVQRSTECAVFTEYAPHGSLYDAVAAPDTRLWTLPMPPLEVTRLVAEIAVGVHTLHANGLIHGGLKLSNVLLFAATDGLWHAKITDALLHEGFVNGTLRIGTNRPTDLSDPWRYVAPEQYAQHPDLTSDQYALGVIAFLLLTGESPYPIDPIAYLQTREPPPIQAASALNAILPATVDDVLRRSLQRLPRNRYTSTRAFAEDLRRAFGYTSASHAVQMIPGSIPLANQQVLEDAPITQSHEIVRVPRPLAVRNQMGSIPVPGLPDLPPEYQWTDEVVSQHSRKLPVMSPAAKPALPQRRQAIPAGLIATITFLLLVLSATLILLLVHH